ncbi:rho GTPase-activating protein 19-like isoform X2 [Corythoichthys intestinalis]|uniref:rho GTPase-activating protein 19-like isoform X2 n=1 Tax=Corythoichthys intestinalis TaxID=161448 RepID=UPI0025A526A0|nr:rho GTPase-activating protein 19-like isoform X2 [Corythoichthys intestinalis]XP_061792228.1 rho GTPase-activating protein 19-like [Nerophis lumbriciformis]
MAAGKDANESTPRTRHISNMVGHHDNFPGGPRSSPHPPVIFNPDFFVEKLRHENAEVFLELVLSNITRLIDLPGVEFSQLLGEDGPKTPGFFRSFNFLKRKDKSTMFGPAISESGVAHIYRLIEYLSKNLHVEGLFRIPGNSVRQHALKELLTSGKDVDLHSGNFHPHDVATLLKSSLGELPEPLLTHRHFHAHLKIADMTLLDEHGNKTSVPNKERQVEALQLLLLLLPSTNRALLKMLLDLLYHTAKQQDANKMSAFNLALMFAPHVLWPRHMTANDLKDHLKTLNNSMAFLIRYSQKLFRAPVYLREHARAHFMKITTMRSKDDLDLLSQSGSPGRQVSSPLKRRVVPARIKGPSEQCQSPAQQYTEEALKDLFKHVHHNMPDSAKKKKLVRQLVKQTAAVSATSQQDGTSKKRPRSRSFAGLIKRKARADQLTPDAVTRAVHKCGKENVILQQVKTPLNDGKQCNVGLVFKNPDFDFSRDNAVKVFKDTPSSVARLFSSPQEVSL